MQALVVEDHDLYRDVLGLALKESGFEVSFATNGIEAIKMLLSLPNVVFNLIIIDHNMPFMNGEELLNDILDKKIKFKKIIFLSGILASKEASEKFQKKADIIFASKDLPILEIKRMHFSRQSNID